MISTRSSTPLFRVVIDVDLQIVHYFDHRVSRDDLTRNLSQRYTGRQQDDDKLQSGKPPESSSCQSVVFGRLLEAFHASSSKDPQGK